MIPAGRRRRRFCGLWILAKCYPLLIAACEGGMAGAGVYTWSPRAGFEDGKNFVGSLSMIQAPLKILAGSRDGLFAPGRA